MRALSRLVLITLVTISMGTLIHAAPDIDKLAVGATGILCYQEPCPRRGIVDAGKSEPALKALLWSGQELPLMEGDEADLRRVEKAWKNFERVLIQGTFEDGVLRIERILEVDR